MKAAPTGLLLTTICGLVLLAGCGTQAVLARRSSATSQVQRERLGGLVVTVETTTDPRLLPSFGHPAGSNVPTDEPVPRPARGKRLLALIATAENPTPADIYMWVGPDLVLTDSAGHKMRVVIQQGYTGGFNHGPSSADLSNQGLAPGDSSRITAEWEVPADGRDFTFTWDFGPLGVASFRVH